MASAGVKTESQDRLVTRYAPLVRRIARHLITRLPPSLEKDDLVQAGMIGLLEAAQTYDPSLGTSFETHAGTRIRGSMLDEIRKVDWTPRSVYRKVRQLAEAARLVESEYGRPARDREVAQRLGFWLDKYHQALQDASDHKVLSLEDLPADEDSIAAGLPRENIGPLERLLTDEFLKGLDEAFSRLSDRQQLVVSLCYEEDRTLHEIGGILGVSEARVCQIRTEALTRLKARMKAWGIY